MAEFKGFMNTEATIDELMDERHLWSMLAKDKRQARIHDISGKMARANKSDPFMYDRVYTHLTTNIATPDDYRNQLKSR